MTKVMSSSSLNGRMSIHVRDRGEEVQGEFCRRRKHMFNFCGGRSDHGWRASGVAISVQYCLPRRDFLIEFGEEWRKGKKFLVEIWQKYFIFLELQVQVSVVWCTCSVYVCVHVNMWREGRENACVNVEQADYLRQNTYLLELQISRCLISFLKQT